jgi:hypothetical protein
VHGAAGGLGTLALQTLSAWGAQATAIAKGSDIPASLAAGAAQAVERNQDPFGDLKGGFDVTLNFAAWDDESKLLSSLRQGALGHATTVHPLMHNFDEGGWLGGTLRTIRQKREMRKRLPRGTRNLCLGSVSPGSGSAVGNGSARRGWAALAFDWDPGAASRAAGSLRARAPSRGGKSAPHSLTQARGSAGGAAFTRRRVLTVDTSERRLQGRQHGSASFCAIVPLSVHGRREGLELTFGRWRSGIEQNSVTATSL